MKLFTMKNIIILILILVFSISLYYFFKDNEEKNIIQKPSINKEEKINIPKLNSKERKITIAVVINFNDCVDLSGEEKMKCLDQANYNASVLDDDITYCLEVNNYDQRSECIYEWVRDLYSTRNCQRIPNHHSAEICVQDLSIVTRYSGFCEALKDEPHEKQECLDRTAAFVIPEKHDINKCSSIKTLEYKNLCFQHFYNSCDDLKKKDDRDDCNSGRDYYLVHVKDDCYKLHSEKYKKVCLAKFSIENIGKDSLEMDQDGDGLWDEKELWMNTDPFNPDTDNDGFSDYEEVIEGKGGDPLSSDTDGDGLSDYEEIELGTNVKKVDTDGDGVWDSVDKDPLSGDSDNDGLADSKESLWGTDINNRDTDGDGLSDYEEIINGKNPLGEGWKSDTDGDGLLDVDEIFYLTDPLKADTDGDGVNDKDEIEVGTNPLGSGDFDFDGDRLSDKEEEKLGTNKYRSDTNGDGITDYEAVKRGLDPISKDTDGDGLSNAYEIKYGTSPVKSDTDGDGLSDGDELNIYFTNPNDLDTDNDGFLDGEEIQAGFNPRSASEVQ